MSISGWKHLETLDRSRVAAFSVKMCGALGLFWLTAALALSDLGHGKLSQRRTFWSGVNIAFAAVNLLGAALMRSLR